MNVSVFLRIIFEETWFYCFFAGIVFGALFVLLAICLLAAIPRSGIKVYFGRISRILVFLCILFFMALRVILPGYFCSTAGSISRGTR